MSSTSIAYLYLGMAIICEVVGTTFLVKSEQFTRLVPTLMTGILYMVSFYLFTHTLKTLPLGIAYAMWGGLGIVITSIIGIVIFKQNLDTPAVLGIVMIVGGVVVMNVFSNSIGH